jgi:hypothetical protein
MACCRENFTFFLTFLFISALSIRLGVFFFLVSVVFCANVPYKVGVLIQDIYDSYFAISIRTAHLVHTHTHAHARTHTHTHTHTVLSALPQQQWFRERATLLHWLSSLLLLLLIVVLLLFNSCFSSFVITSVVLFQVFFVCRIVLCFSYRMLQN